MGQLRSGIQRTILHVDDDRQLTDIVDARLTSHGYEVTALHDPTKAMDRLVDGAFRVVLLDVAMPGLHGMQLLRQIKAFDGGIQVIILTGLLTMTTVLESMRAGAEACIFKPVTDIEPLLDAISKSFDKLDRWWLTLDELSRRRRIEKVFIEQDCSSAATVGEES